MVRHIIFWKIKDDEQKQANLEKMREKLLSLTGKINGIVSAEIGFNFSSSEYDIILDAIFVNPFALKQYQSHPENIKLKKFADAIQLDCVTCDYMIDPADTMNKQGGIPDMQAGGSPTISISQDMRAPIARVNKNSEMMDQELDENDRNQGRYNDNFDNNYNESYNNAPSKRKTLARSVNNVDDSAFALPYDNDSDYQRDDDSFDLPFNKQQSNRARQGQKQQANVNNNLRNTQNLRNQMRNTSGQLPFIDQNTLDSSALMNGNDTWKCPKCGKVNAGYVNMCSCGRRKPVMQGGMQPNKRMIQKPQNSALINSGALPNLSEIQDMKSPRGGMGNTGMLPIQPMQKPVDPMNKQGSKMQGGMSKRGSRQNPFAGANGDDFNQTSNFRGNGGRQQGQGPRNGLELPGPEMMGSGQGMSENTDAPGTWTCPNCGKTNSDYVGLCGCGQRKTVEMFNPNNDFKQGQQQSMGGQPLPSRKNGMNMSQRGGNKTGMNMNQPGGSGGMHSLNDAINNFKSKNMQMPPNVGMSQNDSMGFFDDNNYDSEQGQGQGPSRNTGSGFRVNPQMQRMQNENMDSWKCPRCGKINGNFVGQCGCGQRKPARAVNRMDY